MLESIIALLQKRTFFDREMQEFSLILQAIYE